MNCCRLRVRGISMYRTSIGQRTYQFPDLKSLMAKASPARSGDYLAGVAAATAEERMAAKICLADLPLKAFLENALIPYEEDEITRLIMDEHDLQAFSLVSHLTVGDFRDWLLSEHADSFTLARLAPGLTPEMVAAVSKLMRNQDLILVAKKCQVITKFRNTIGLPGRLSVRRCSLYVLVTVFTPPNNHDFASSLCCSRTRNHAK